MYELVWNRSGYQIIPRDTSAEKRPASISSSSSRGQSLLAKHQPAQSHPVSLTLWKRFVHTGQGDLGALNSAIAQSWQRCRKLGVDPAFGKCWDIRDETELGQDRLLLREIVTETCPNMFEIMRSRGLLITVSDHKGYLLGMWGDHQALRGAEKLNFGPGANWSEGSVGTNAIGTALAFGHPLRVTGREHFCESHHSWICSAAPIFNLQGQVMACIDISGPMVSNHDQALELAIRGARAIEGRLYQQHALNLQHQSSHVISSVFNTVMSGLVYLDLNGVIQSANPAACLLLGRDGDQLAGEKAVAYFHLERALRQLNAAPGKRLAAGVEIALRGHPQSTAQAHLITSANGTPAGYLLVIQKRRQPHISIPAAPPRRPDAFSAIIGNSAAMHSALDTARRVAPMPTTVLISGESGTGKEIIARALHQAGCRPKGPFVAVNCGAIAPELIQSELFGYVEGAFTGARRGGSPGKFEQASGGTLFLDEIAEMPPSLQVNLLRVLEEGQVTRVGGTHPVAVDVRIVTATNKDLPQQVREGRFRQDLFYRLNVVGIRLPPLRKRGDDVRHLADHFIVELAGKLGRPVRRVEPEFYQCLARYAWPGNVRELRHAIEGAIALMAADLLCADDLPQGIRRGGAPHPLPQPNVPPSFNLETLQKETIRRAQTYFKGNVSRMAAALGIGRNTLYAKLKKFGLNGSPSQRS
ncbi:MAG: sigma-54-dependent Fis family transcriptional regulator [Desulfobacterales bacterium]